MENQQLPSRQFKYLYPDRCSWLVPDFVAVCKNFQNEFGLTLWNALNEYVSFHNPDCAFQGKNYEGELFLYPVFDYNHDQRRATLKKLFYISKPVKTIFMHDYLSQPGNNPNKTPFFNLLNRSVGEKFEDFPELEFMVISNNMEPSLAKEVLLKTSFYRRSLKRGFVLEKEAEGIEYKSINVVSLEFDVSFLNDCAFLNAKRYSSFRNLLPKNMIITIGCRLEFDLPEVPKALKKQQLLDAGVNSL